MSRYKVPAAERAEVAQALIAAADNPDLEVRTSGDGEFIVSDELWEKAMSGQPAADVPQPADDVAEPEDDEPGADEPEVAEDGPEPVQDEPAPPPAARRARHGKK